MENQKSSFNKKYHQIIFGIKTKIIKILKKKQNHHCGIVTQKCPSILLLLINHVCFSICLQLEHNKTYENEIEERFRMKIFHENRGKIAQHNQLYAQKKVSFKLGLNKYADLLHTEFKDTMNGFNHSMHKLLR